MEYFLAVSSIHANVTAALAKFVNLTKEDISADNKFLKQH